MNEPLVVDDVTKPTPKKPEKLRHREQDVTSKVTPNKVKADPMARARRKFAKAGVAQLHKWARRQIRFHDALLLDSKRWKADLPEDSPLTLRDYPEIGRLLAARAALEAIGNELAVRSNDKQAASIMAVAVNSVVAISEGEKTCEESPTTEPTKNQS